METEAAGRARGSSAEERRQLPSSGSQILKLMQSCLKTYFTFDETIYEQVKGTPLCSPILRLIVEVVLQRLESLVFRHHRPKIWARYVDDTFIVIERDRVLEFKEHLDATFPGIQFTTEEENNQLVFFNALVCRKDRGGLKTKAFRKATNTTHVLSYNRNHPISHKRSCVRTLYQLVEKHCGEPEDKFAELQYLRRIFRANGNPLNFVNQCLPKRGERRNPTGLKFWRALPTTSPYPRRADLMLLNWCHCAALISHVSCVPLVVSASTVYFGLRSDVTVIPATGLDGLPYMSPEEA
ncbi:hypothetical protein SprV_0200692100 [Sparganum proliferum]